MNNIKDQENINQKVILLRLDLNVPLKNGVITDQTRIDKMTSENLDGLIVAKAALNRLKIAHPNIYIF